LVNQTRRRAADGLSAWNDLLLVEMLCSPTFEIRLARCRGRLFN
jgi:hypothetical protein